MGDANAGSTITAKMNRQARWRSSVWDPRADATKQPPALGGKSAWLTDLANPNVKAYTVATRKYGGVALAATLRDKEHLQTEVPEDILRQSREFIWAVESNNLPASYAVSRGKAWEVKLALSVIGGEVQAQVSWVIPIKTEL